MREVWRTSSMLTNIHSSGCVAWGTSRSVRLEEREDILEQPLIERRKATCDFGQLHANDLTDDSSILGPRRSECTPRGPVDALGLARAVQPEPFARFPPDDGVDCEADHGDQVDQGEHLVEQSLGLRRKRRDWSLRATGLSEGVRSRRCTESSSSCECSEGVLASAETCSGLSILCHLSHHLREQVAFGPRRSASSAKRCELLLETFRAV